MEQWTDWPQRAQVSHARIVRRVETREGIGAPDRAAGRSEKRAHQAIAIQRMHGETVDIHEQRDHEGADDQPEHHEELAAQRAGCRIELQLPHELLPEKSEQRREYERKYDRSQARKPRQ